MSFLNKIGLRTQIYSGFGILLVLLLVIGALSTLTLQGINTDFTTYRGYARNSNLTSEMGVEMLLARMQVKNFVISANEETARAVDEQVDVVQALLTDAQKHITDPERAAIIERIVKQLEEYEALFDEVKTLQAERDTLVVGTLDKLGPQILEHLDEIMRSARQDGDLESAYDAANVLENFMHGRLGAQKYLLNNDQALVALADEELQDAIEAVDALIRGLQNPRRLSLARTLRGQVEEYKTTFDRVVITITNRNDRITNGLDRIGPQVARDAKDIIARYTNDQDTLGPRVQSNLESAVSTNIIVAVVSLVFGLLAAILIPQGILMPIRNMIQAMSRLARGEREVEILGTERTDALGEMARALTQIGELGQRAQRAQAALDNVSANVMMADEGGTIVYINPAVRQMMRAAESDIRKEMPAFAVDKIVGSSIDSFHKNPAHQRSILAGMNTTHKGKIEVGGRTFDIGVNPVVNDKGDRLGTVIEWVDRTQELAIEKEVAGIVDAAAAGDLAKRVSLEGKSGFMRQLSEGLNSILHTVSLAVEDIGAMMSALSRGDLTRRIDKQYAGAFEKLKVDSNDTSERLGDIVERIIDSTDLVSSASGEIASGASDLSERTEQQAASLEETAASMEELAATVRQNSENAQQANQLAAGARTVAERGGEVVSEAVRAMGSIEHSSQKISDIISVIDEIAFQTNLLALNAAVEAARAGEAGKGFAVVASEVRTLAQRSAQAAKDIKSLIVDSNTQVKEGVELVNNTGQTLDEIVSSVKRVADIVSEIAAASTEQTDGLEQVNTAVSQMDEMTQKNAALVEESAAAAKSLEEQSEQLSDLISFFTTHRKGTGTSRSQGASARTSHGTSATGSTGMAMHKPAAHKPAATTQGKKPGSASGGAKSGHGAGPASHKPETKSTGGSQKDKANQAKLSAYAKSGDRKGDSSFTDDDDWEEF